MNLRMNNDPDFRFTLFLKCKMVQGNSKSKHGFYELGCVDISKRFEPNEMVKNNARNYDSAIGHSDKNIYHDKRQQ